MSELLKSVDIAQFEMGKQKYYYLEGWVHRDGADEYEVKVFGDGAEIECEIVWRERPDVASVLKDTQLAPKPGYSIRIYELDDLCQNYQNVQVVLQGEEEEMLYEVGHDELHSQWQKALLAYNVEQIKISIDKLRICGWVFDRADESVVDIAIEDEAGNEIPFYINRTVRLDVNEDCCVKNPDIKSGFDIRINLENTHIEELRINFSAGEITQVYTMDMKKFWKDHSKFAQLKNVFADKQKAKALIREKGLRGFMTYAQCQMNLDSEDYNVWMKLHKPTLAELKEQKKEKFAYEPLISIVIPLYNTPTKYLKELLLSLTEQSYSNLQICLADGSTKDSVGKYIHRRFGRDKRIRYKRLKKNRGISENTNAAIAMATGDFVMFSDHDDVLEKNALYEIVKAINEDPENVDAVYTDEDKVTMDGKTYFESSFKPDFNIDFLRESNYICHIFAVRKTILDEVGYLRSEYDGAQDYDMVLRCCEQARVIKHVPKILYHWRSHPASTAENPEDKQYAFDAGREAIQEHYRRIGSDGQVYLTNIFGRYRTEYPIHGNPLISIIVPTKDHVEDLDLCLKSVTEKSTYENYEIIVVENNSTDPETFAYYETMQEKYPKTRLITWEDEFNYAAINNFAIPYCNGEYLVLLNNDIEVITPDWMEKMLMYCQREDTGAVGVKLYYPDDTVQHAGVIIGMGGIAGHIFSGTPRKEYGYQTRLLSVQDMSAVTAACMMIKTSVFKEVGGFDEGYKVAFNDVDLCMKIREAGHLIVFTPYVEMYHYESKSRGHEETASQQKRFLSEIERFEEKWSDILEKGDPYYNPNLSLDNGNCTLKEEKWMVTEE